MSSSGLFHRTINDDNVMLTRRICLNSSIKSVITIKTENLIALMIFQSFHIRFVSIEYLLSGTFAQKAMLYKAWYFSTLSINYLYIYITECVCVCLSVYVFHSTEFIF